ncbi:site-specific integrase [Oceanobacter sp. 3_MG-2023]|uniref:tyrosine-type recombinase/integrase n=1 Tax=Oceanobacter sp. 3_MG-2023 TaxID=3062622 RepID=UPI002734E23D|nr:site-specific integrase [Oceanobacter sp. 3_MG-2023]MDP2505425.1 site-specific integrase [Oceanobacter sp. 3_MG-2023]
MALSDSWLKANSSKAREKRSEVSDRDGLSVRVTPAGKITFQMRFRYAGKAARLDLGTYPLLTLKNARAECLRLRAELEQGHDPRVVRQLEKQAVQEAGTLEDLIRQWYQSYCVANKKGHREILRSFEIYVFPKIGQLPADKVTLHEWLAVLEPLAKSVPGIADRILTNSKQALKWGVRRRLVTLNVLSDMKAAEDLNVKKQPGSRSLSAEEIRYFWLAVDQSRMIPRNKLFLKLCLVFACRNGELRVARKNHFDFDLMVWTVPPENHKMGKSTGKPLLRPIVEGVADLIQDAFLLAGDSDYLFPDSSNLDSPMGPSVPLQLPYNIRQWLRRHQGYEMAHWSVHDLRKTARTNFSELTEPHVAEIMLGHKLPGQWQVYDQYDYLKEQATAYSRWWARLSDICLG